MNKFFVTSVVLIVASLLIYNSAFSGSLTPTSTPAATSYTLTDIYNRINTNATATEGSHSFSPGGAPSGSLFTLKQIYEAIPTIVADNVRSGTSYLGVTGTLLPNGGTATVGGLFNGLTAHLTGDYSLDTGTLNLACNTATFDASGNLVANSYDGGGDGTNRWCMTDSGDAVAGDVFSAKVSWVDGQAVTGTLNLACNTSTFDTSANLVANAYDGGGSGSNRWCMTESGDAVAGDILSGKIAWIDGQAVTGTIATQTLSASSTTVSAGYYNATNLNTVDTDLTAANIVSGITIFGVAGSATAGANLSNMFNGTITSFTGGSQANGGGDDYHNGGSPATSRYVSTWTTCDSGNSYCGTGLASAKVRDENTGLIWSYPCNGSGCSSFSDSSPLTYSWSNGGANNNGQTASQLCSAGSHGESGWSLPHQKQLMQAYVDGAYGNLVPTATNLGFWSATTYSTTTTSAWRVYLSGGFVDFHGKTNGNNVRCVR